MRCFYVFYLSHESCYEQMNHSCFAMVVVLFMWWNIVVAIMMHIYMFCESIPYDSCVLWVVAIRSN